MTSVKLTDMMTANTGDVISSLGTAVGTANASSDKQDFATVMNDTAKSGRSSEKTDVSTGQIESKTDVQESYQASAKSDAMDRKVMKSETANMDKFQNLQENQEELTEDFTQGMKGLLMGKLNVSEQDLEEAMTALGLSYMDLLNPANLTQLAVQLTDTEDACTLLMNEDFTDILQQSEQLMSELTETTGLSRDELLSWMETQNQEVPMEMEPMSDMTQAEYPEYVETVPEEATEFENTAEEPDAEAELQVHPEENAKILQKDEQPVAVETETIKAVTLSQEKEMQPQDHVSENKKQDDVKETGVAAEEAPVQETKDSQPDQAENEMFEKDDGGHREGKPEQVSHSQTAGFENARTEVITETNVQPQTNTARVDVENLMRQFGEFARIHINQDTTSIDMQLNPENLGKLYLHVSTGKEGNVTAEIATTSQEVKEALETQIAELRVTLVQQGVKVDAVEVTVASHEFEQNLEQNAAHDQRQGEEQEQQNQGRVRSLLRGELDDLSGLASEEEILAARIMKDNGNSMDVTV
ncbi:MAG: flagellar hook-length control protein FliK [Lachnospiraceae bacterium]|nr:flagellar hook-length control protein FliK [Lachnospiraceae bacterium]